jgi:hypothetical protein
MTVSTVELDFALANNESWENQFTLNAGGDAGDIVTGSKVHMQMRSAADSLNVALDASVDNGLLIVNDAAGGLVTLDVTAKQMRSIVAGSYVYDLLVERPTGRVYRLFVGTVSLAQGVTEPIVTPPAS